MLYIEGGKFFLSHYLKDENDIFDKTYFNSIRPQMIKKKLLVLADLKQGEIIDYSLHTYNRSIYNHHNCHKIQIIINRR